MEKAAQRIAHVRRVARATIVLDEIHGEPPHPVAQDFGMSPELSRLRSAGRSSWPSTWRTSTGPTSGSSSCSREGLVKAQGRDGAFTRSVEIIALEVMMAD